MASPSAVEITTPLTRLRNVVIDACSLLDGFVRVFGDLGSSGCVPSFDELAELAQILLAGNEVRRVFLVQIVHRIPVGDELLRNDEVVVFGVVLRSHLQRFFPRLAQQRRLQRNVGLEVHRLPKAGIPIVVIVLVQLDLAVDDLVVLVFIAEAVKHLPFGAGEVIEHLERGILVLRLGRDREPAGFLRDVRRSEALADALGWRQYDQLGACSPEILHAAVVQVEYFACRAGDDAGFALVEGVLLRVPLLRDELRIQQAFLVQLVVEGQLFLFAFRDFGVFERAVILFDPRFVEAERRVEDRIDLCDVARRRQRISRLAGARLLLDQLLEEGVIVVHGRVFRQRLGAVHRLEPIFPDDRSLRSERLDPEQVRIAGHAGDVMRLHDVFDVLGFIDIRSQVLQKALLGHLLVAALEINDVRNRAAEQQQVQVLGVAALRKVDQLELDVQALILGKRFLQLSEKPDRSGVRRALVLVDDFERNRLTAAFRLCRAGISLVGGRSARVGRAGGHDDGHRSRDRD
ncbi:hypothetical protein BN871_DK_00220 [Paenibacillus sp. P22]|nr:hypothetical protein BN871_DK_00220 [Paenibacillus sp. P22]